MSLTIGIRFLTGYCVAARSKTDPRPEWPPHPARVFMALAASYFEDAFGHAEQAALTWLESLDAPRICYSVQAMPTSAVATFVPANDSSSISKGGSIQTLPSLKRHRAERSFPRTHLPEQNDSIYLFWPDAADLPAHRDALAKLCACVGRIGHSRSLVQAWIADNFGNRDELGNLETYVPVPTSSMPMRVATRGTLLELERAHTVPPYRATIKSSRFYARQEEMTLSPPVQTIFDARIEVLRLSPAGSEFRHLALATTLALTATLRESILANCPKDIPETVSGHGADRSPSMLPHVAILPLAFVGGEHGDGHLMGTALALPHEMSRPDQAKLAAAIDAIADDEELGTVGSGLGFKRRGDHPGLGQWRITRHGALDESRKTLNTSTWTSAPAGARRWASVTPFVFDQHAKSKNRADYLDECAELVRAAVLAQLRPDEGASDVRVNVRVTPVSPITGVPAARDFPRLKRKDGSERRHTHVELWFDRPVVGPLLAGAGRFRGYGLFRPMSDPVDGGGRNA